MKEKFESVSNTENGILTKLFRMIIFDTGLINKIPYNINRYIRNGGKKNKATISRLILSGEMSWRSFIFLLFDILRVKKCTFKVTLEYDVGPSSEHEISISPAFRESNKEKGKVDGEKSNKKI